MKQTKEEEEKIVGEFDISLIELIADLEGLDKEQINNQIKGKKYA